MSGALTVALAFVGIGTTTYGWVRYLRYRFPRRRDMAIARRARRNAVIWTVLGGLLALNPDALSWLLLDADPHRSTLGDFFLLGYRLWTGFMLCVVYGSMFICHKVAGSRERRRELKQQRMQTPTAAPRPSLTKDWGELLARDTELSRRFLLYDKDLEAAVNFPVMRDYRDPLTTAALHAMLRCDELRSLTPPAGTGTARDTPYGTAVTDFAVALTAAEDNARRLRWSNFTEDERRSLDTAAKMLAFVQSNTTTPAEREVAYKRVVAELGRIPPSKFSMPEETIRRAIEGLPALTAASPGLQLTVVDPQPEPARAHPFLDIEQRAARW